MLSEKIMKNTVRCNADLNTVWRALARIRGKYLLVLDENNRIAGSVCEQDIRTFLKNGGSANAEVSEVMDRNADVTAPDRDVLPEVDENGVLCGMIFRRESGLDIRELTRDDLDAVFDFFDRMDPEGKAFVNHGDGNRIQLIRYLTDGIENQIHFGAFHKESGKMVGYVFLVDTNCGVPALGIAVSGETKGLGMGQILLEFLNDYAIGQGYGGLMLITSPANIRGQRLYERMGFQYLGIHPSRELFYLKRFPRN